jgi:hypothetical protein
VLFNRGLAARMSAVLEQTYDSKVTVYRKVDYKDGNLTKQKPEKIYTDIPCRRSKSGLSAIFATTDAAKITRSEKLFTSPEWDIKTGDELYVTGPSSVIQARDPDRYFAGETQLYGSHQEIKLEIQGRA